MSSGTRAICSAPCETCPTMRSTSATEGVSPDSTRPIRREKTVVASATASAGPVTDTWLPRTQIMASDLSSIRRSSASAGPIRAVGSTESGMVRRMLVGSMLLLASFCPPLGAPGRAPSAGVLAR